VNKIVINVVKCCVIELWTGPDGNFYYYYYYYYMFNDLFSRKTCIIQYQKGTRSSAIAEGPRYASCQLKFCQLPCNSAETTYTTSPDRIDGMKLEI